MTYDHSYKNCHNCAFKESSAHEAPCVSCLMYFDARYWQAADNLEEVIHQFIILEVVI
jgi:hypothetical protein